MRKAIKKNVTLSLDSGLLEKARAYAHSHNISLSELVRRLVAQAVGRKESEFLDEMFELMDKVQVSSDGKRWSREDLYRV